MRCSSSVERTPNSYRSFSDTVVGFCAASLRTAFSTLGLTLRSIADRQLAAPTGRTLT